MFLDLHFPDDCRTLSIQASKSGEEAKKQDAATHAERINESSFLDVIRNRKNPHLPSCC